MQKNTEPYYRKANYYETDKMGIVHHSNYIRWFEEARLDFMGKLGISYADIENEGILMPVIGISCKYKVPVSFDEEVIITTKIAFFNGVSMKFSYEIYKDGGNTLSVLGQSDHCFINGVTHIPVNLKKCKGTAVESCMRLMVDLDKNKERSPKNEPCCGNGLRNNKSDRQ